MSRSKAWCAVVVTASLASLTLPVRAQTTWYLDEDSTGPKHNGSSDGRGLVPGDCDGDGDVDLNDWVVLEAVLTGPAMTVDAGSSCGDFDGDADVDLLDATVFATLFTGGTFVLADTAAWLDRATRGRTDLNVILRSNSSSSITVAPGAEVHYRVLGMLSDTMNEGLAFFGLDLTFSGGDLLQADTPGAGTTMSSFVIPDGVTNPAGYGGTTSVPGREGDLVQIGGGQNTIMNGQGSCTTTADCPGTYCVGGVCEPVASFPVGTVITGVAHPAACTVDADCPGDTSVCRSGGCWQVLVTGTLTAPDALGPYALSIPPESLFAAVIREGETGAPFWQTEAAKVGTVTSLIITVATFEDCNENGVPDDQDIADCDGSPWCDDCNGNGIPDECEDDKDADGVIDECDNCPNDYNPGQEDSDGNGIGDACEQIGCGTLLVQVNEHRPGLGGSTIVGIEGLELCVFDKSEGSCARGYGVSRHHYPEVFNNCDPVACQTTDADGAAGIVLDAGDYLLIGEYDPDGFPPNYDGDERCIGVSASDFECAPDGDPNTVRMRKHLQVIILPNGRTVGVEPRGGASDGRLENGLVELTNVAGPDDSVSVVTRSDGPHPAAGGYGAIARGVVVDSSLNAGELFVTVSMPFDGHDLAGADPLSVNLANYNANIGRWELAVAANAQPSAGHEPYAIGDRFVVVDSVIPMLSDHLGDYGVFWDPAAGEGFVWANVDYGAEFAAAVSAQGDPEAIPAVSEWGLIVLGLLLLTVAKIYFGRRRRAAA